MTEDELLSGVTGALTAGAWMWHHVRRSDLAQQMGHAGWPDLFALQPAQGRVLVAELKTEHGRLEPLQSVWLEAFRACGLDTRVVRPADYQALVEELGEGRYVVTGRKR